MPRTTADLVINQNEVQTISGTLQVPWTFVRW